MPDQISSSAQISEAKTEAEIAAVREIFLEYLQFVERYLGQDLSFQGTDKEFADFPQTYDALFLARLDGTPVAACGVKPFKPGICELKRLYCRPAGRGHGLGLKLSAAAYRKSARLKLRSLSISIQITGSPTPTPFTKPSAFATSKNITTTRWIAAS